METFKLFVSALCCIGLSIYSAELVQFFQKICYSYEETNTLVVGILSARENFQYRDAIRSTWLKNFNYSSSNKVKAWFIIGNSSCNIPPKQRISEYGCEKLQIDSKSIAEEFHVCHESIPETTLCLSSDYKMFHQGFTFKVNLPVIINELGVLSKILIPEKNIRIALMDVQTKEIVVESVLPSNDSHYEDGFLYNSIDSILLPKNYEGLILIEGSVKVKECSNLEWSNGGGVISFKRIYRSPSHIDSIAHSFYEFSAVSAKFFIPDLNDLKASLAKQNIEEEKWTKMQDIVSVALEKEKSAHKDILTVDVMDIYRNLPSKLLKFVHWLSNNEKFSYLLKSDDDCVVDLQHIFEILQNNSRFNSKKYWIWSRFRKGWPVHYIGKWAEDDYRSPYYPPFPCGASYILSYSTANWLSSNAHMLYPYQGEDVSMGIWLSAINPDFIDDDRFECDSKCTLKSFNQAQLTAVNIYEVWQNYRKCGHLCSYDETR